MEEKKCVLIVDDEKNIVNILKFNLQKEGYQTLEAYDGETGLALALQKNPDLILLDVMLPKMIGWDVCKKLRQSGSNIPVIILTAREEEEDKAPWPGNRSRRLYHQAFFHPRVNGSCKSQYPPHCHAETAAVSRHR